MSKRAKPLGWSELECRYSGKKFRRRAGGKQETLLVIDVTLGAELVIRSPREQFTRRVSQGWWAGWVAKAKEIS